jgi:hypothetical protein
MNYTDEGGLMKTKVVRLPLLDPQIRLVLGKQVFVESCFVMFIGNK